MIIITGGPTAHLAEQFPDATILIAERLQADILAALGAVTVHYSPSLAPEGKSFREQLADHSSCLIARINKARTEGNLRD